MKILIYCTMAKPWLCYDEQQKKYALRYGKRKDTDLNGTVCFKCECKEAFKYDFVHRSGDSSNFYIRDQRTERMKDCLSNDDLFDYGKGKTLYAYHFENVKPIDPMPITHLFKDEACTIPLTRAPQSYCFAYRIAKLPHQHFMASKELLKLWYSSVHNGDNTCAYLPEKCLVFSIQSPWCCKIGNLEKDLEIRKSCPKEIKVVACNAQN